MKIKLVPNQRRLLFLIVLFASHLYCFSQTSKVYYVDAVSGNDANNGLSASAAWQTVNKVSKSNFQPGDSILFKRGQTFYGSVKAASGGAIYASYGSGDKPVISGLTLLSNWASVGNGVYESACPSCGVSLNLVTVNGALQPMGRYPNRSDANGGYLTIDTHTGTSSITDAALPSSPQWTGGEVVIRKRNWLLDRCAITSHSGQTIQYISPTGYDPNDKYGYFIQNHPSTLDQPGEWYYDRANKKVRMFFGSSSPSSYVINVSTVDTLFFLPASGSRAVLSDLTLVGSDTASIRINGATAVQIRNCEINLSGTDGIKANNADSLVIDNVLINYTNNDAIECYTTNNGIVQNSIIKNTGLLPGMGLSNNQNYEAIFLSGDKNTIQYNRVDSTGYSAITFNGNYTVVKNNFINNYTMTMDDGGGIYTWGDYNKVGRKVTGNIIVNGIGAAYGTDLDYATSAHGIYTDDRSAGIDIVGNTVAHANGSALYLHNSHEMNVMDNTFFNNRAQLFYGHDYLEVNDPIRNVVTSNNLLFSKLPGQIIASFSSTTNDIKQFGTFNNNYYARPFDNLGTICTSYPESNYNFRFYYDLNSWAAAFGQDLNSQSASPIAPYTINSLVGSNIFTNGSFSSNTNGVFCLSSPSSCGTSWSNNAGLDGGAVQASYNTSGGANIDRGVYFDLGPVKANKDYIIRFSMIGANKADKTIEAFLLRSSQPYYIHSESKYFEIRSSRTENEYLYHSTADENVTLALGLMKGDTTFWVDNMQMFEANVSKTNPDDSIRFVYNETGAVKSFSLNGNYKDVKGNTFTGTISLQPYSSAVLMLAASSTGVAPNQPPVANAGNDINIQLPVSSASLTGTASYDPDGSIVSYQWSYISGPGSYTFANNSAASTDVSNLVQGTYSFKLLVTDNKGTSASDTVVVNVSAGNQSPVARAGSDITISLPANTATLDGSASYDPDGTITKYAWAKVSGPSQYTLTNAGSAAAQLSNLAKGTYIFKLTVTDNNNIVARDSVKVVVLANQRPIARAGNDLTITLPINAVTLDGSASYDPDGTITKYAWAKVSGPSSYTFTSAGSATTDVINLVKGTYIFRLAVTDNGSLVGRDSVTVTVLPAPAASQAAASQAIEEEMSKSTRNEAYLIVFPNPVVNTLHLQYADSKSGPLKIRIFNAAGKILMDLPLQKDQPLLTKELNISGFTSGFYYLQLMLSDGKSFTEPFFKR